MDNTTMWKPVTYEDALKMCENASEAIPCVIIKKSGQLITGWSMHYQPCCSYIHGKGSEGGLRVGYKTDKAYHYELVEKTSKTQIFVKEE